MDYPHVVVKFLSIVAAIFGASDFCSSQEFCSTKFNSIKSVYFQDSRCLPADCQATNQLIGNNSLVGLLHQVARQGLMAGCSFAGPANTNNSNDDGRSASKYSFRKSSSIPVPVFVLSNKPQTTGIEDELFPGVSSVWMNFQKHAKANLVDPTSWLAVNSDIASRDGLFVPKSIATSQHSRNLSVELQDEIFDDPYWTYYSDIDRWGVVIRIDDSRLQRKVVSRNPAIDSKPTLAGANGTSSIKQNSKQVQNHFASNSRSAIIMSTGYAKTSAKQLTFKASVYSMLRFYGNQILQYKNQIRNSIDSWINQIEARFRENRVKPLDRLRYDLAHRLIIEAQIRSNHELFGESAIIETVPRSDNSEIFPLVSFQGLRSRLASSLDWFRVASSITLSQMRVALHRINAIQPFLLSPKPSLPSAPCDEQFLPKSDSHIGPAKYQRTQSQVF